MTRHRPIQIAGGGLAGLSLGIALRQRGVPVTVYESGGYPRHLVCGEFIAGLRAGVPEELGIEPCLNGALALRRSCWRHRGRTVLRKDLPRPALGLSRYELDQRLADQFVQLGGALRTNERLQAIPREPGWVSAHGRKRTESDWIGLKIHCRSLELDSDLELHFGRRGYVGLSRIENGRVNVCGLFRQRATGAVAKSERLFAYLEQSALGGLAERLRAGSPDPDSAAGVAGLSYRPLPADRTIVAIGDHSGLIAPFTGNGMAQALEGAAQAAGPLTAFARGETTWDAAAAAIADQQGRAFGSRRRVARWLHPWLLESRRQNLLGAVAQARLLPFTLLFRLTH